MYNILVMKIVNWRQTCTCDNTIKINIKGMSKGCGFDSAESGYGPMGILPDVIRGYDFLYQPSDS